MSTVNTSQGLMEKLNADVYHASEIFYHPHEEATEDLKVELKSIIETAQKLIEIL